MKNKLWIALLIFIAGKTFAQEEKTTFSLTEAQNYAVENSEKLKRDHLETEIAKKKVWETAAMGLPQVNIEGQFQHFLKIPTTVVDASTFNPAAPEGSTATIQLGTKFNTTGTLQATQLIFDGSYIVGLQVSKYYKKYVATTVTLTEEDIRAQVAEAYYNVLLAKENIKVLDSLYINTQKLLDGTKVVRELEMIEQQEVDQLELSVARIKTSIALAKDRAKLAEEFLKMQMGFDYDSNIELSNKVEDFFSETTAQEPLLQEFNPESDLNYQMLQQKMQLDKYALKNEKFKNLPSLAAFFQQQYSAQRNEFNFFQNLPWYPTSVWGLSLKVPVTSSGMRWAKGQQAKIKVEQDQLMIEETERKLKFSEIQKKLAYQSALDQLKLEEKNIELAKKVYRNATIKTDLGKIIALDVVQTQSQLLQAQGNYIAALSNVLTAKNELDKLYRKYASK